MCVWGGRQAGYGLCFLQHGIGAGMREVVHFGLLGITALGDFTSVQCRIGLESPGGYFSPSRMDCLGRENARLSLLVQNSNAVRILQGRSERAAAARSDSDCLGIQAALSKCAPLPLINACSERQKQFPFPFDGQERNCKEC